MTTTTLPSARDLLDKYDVAGPRYTSYPTVPYWETTPTEDQWIAALDAELTLRKSKGDGAGIYIHLPFCEALCTFCACNRVITKKHERATPYIAAVLAEWRLYRDRLGFDRLPLSELHLGGGTPTFLSPEELTTLLAPILAECDTSVAEMSFEADPRVTNVGHLAALYDLGFRRMSLGVQDYDPKVQKMIHREQSPEIVHRLTDAAREMGYTSVNYDLVYGLPGQTARSVHDTIEDVLGQRPDRIAFYSYAHVPWVGNTGQRGFDESDLPSGAEKRNLYDLGRALLEGAGYRELGMDHFALPEEALAKATDAGALFRNFMGYLPRHVSPLLGLGVSAIGDAWTAFSQNTKEIKDYENTVAAGRLPIWRGHLLDDEDLIHRRHVLAVMTRFETTWTDGGADATPALGGVAANLAEFVSDGLVEIDQAGATTSVRVSERGRPFVRNICMAFDARLQRKKPDTALFSRTV